MHPQQGTLEMILNMVLTRLIGLSMVVAPSCLGMITMNKAFKLF